MMSLLAAAVTGATAFFGSIFGFHGPMQPHAEMGSTSQRMEHVGSSTMDRPEFRMGSTSPMGLPVVAGKVTAVNGTSLTVLGRGMHATATSTYSVDATDSKVLKRGVGTTTVASIQTGDFIVVLGTLSDASNATAKLILDGLPLMKAIEEHRMGSTTPGRPGWHVSSTSPMGHRPMPMHPGQTENGEDQQ